MNLIDSQKYFVNYSTESIYIYKTSNVSRDFSSLNYQSLIVDIDEVVFSTDETNPIVFMEGYDTGMFDTLEEVENFVVKRINEDLRSINKTIKELKTLRTHFIS